MLRKYKPGSKLALLQQETQTCEILMKTFCLNPSSAIYKRIAACNSITRGEYYATWSIMVPQVYKQDDMSGVASSVDVSMDVSKNNTSVSPHIQSDLVYRSLMTKLENDPTIKTARQILYCFFASGRFAAVEKYYECMGDNRIAQASRVQLCEEYREAKSLYADKIAELLQKDPEHFSRRGITIQHVDFSHFDQYQAAVDKRKAMQAGKN